MDCRVSPFAPGSPYFEGALQVYVHTWPRDMDDARDFFLRHARYPDYRGFVALLDEQVVGMGFGTRSEPGQWWHDRVAAQVGEDHPALQYAWSLTELCVRAGFRSRGVGERLHDTLLDAQPCPRVLLSTDVANAGARRFYERHGWQYLHHGFPFAPGRPLFVVMCREVGKGATIRPPPD